jgi:hypothetical protein
MRTHRGNLSLTYRSIYTFYNAKVPMVLKLKVGYQCSVLPLSIRGSRVRFSTRTPAIQTEA